MFKQQSAHDQGGRTAAFSKSSFKRDPSLPHRLSFYRHPPLHEVSMEQFERFALDRLLVLKAVEAAQLRRKSEDEYKAAVNTALSQWLPLASDEHVTAPLAAQRQKDRTSHFILRLAYCRSEELRSWFVRQEVALFRHRYTIESSEDRQRFLDHLDLGFKTISAEEKNEMLHDLDAATFGTTAATDNFVQVPFEEAIELVQRRQVHLANGFAYVPQSALAALVTSEYRRRLQDALEVTARALPRLETDDRLLPLLTSIGKQYLGKEYSSGGIQGSIKADDVDKLSPLMPPCMSDLQGRLREDSHLKHFGRMQYGLFLKGIGLSIEEALIFWRRSFNKMTDDQFAKGYAYNIRHNYGMEGKRVNYAPYSCHRIITTNQPGPGDHHGCPFKNSARDADGLRVRLLAGGLRDADSQEIVNLVQGHHYQIACTKHFEATQRARSSNPAHPVETIEHPNHYFDQAFRLHEGGDAIIDDSRWRNRRDQPKAS